MSVRGEKVTDQFGYTRDKMYIDNIANEDVFDFFKKNSPYGKGFGFSQEAVQNYQFKDGNISYKKEEGKKQCFFTPKHTVFGNVMAWFTFDDFSCVYHDYSKNEVDVSDEWCKFVCEKVNDIDYLSNYQDLMHQKMEQLRVEYESKINQMRDQLTDVINIAIGSKEVEEDNNEEEIDYIGEDGYDDEIIEQEVPEMDDAVKRFLDSRIEGDKSFYEDDYADEMGED